MSLFFFGISTLVQQQNKGIIEIYMFALAITKKYY